jgi:ABC-type transporter Mla subunit MlaD
MVGDLATVARTLRERRETLVAAIDAGRTVLATTGRRSAELEQAIDALPGLLAETDGALREIRALAVPLRSGLRATGPLLAELPASLRSLRRMEPETRALVTELAELERLGSDQLPAIRRFTARLPQAATAGRPSVDAAAKTISTLSDYGAGLAQLGDLLSGALSTNDRNGVLARVISSAIEPVKPENFGFDAQQKSLAQGRRASLPAMLAAALEHRCKTDESACLMRLTTPGLPPVEGKP